MGDDGSLVIEAARMCPVPWVREGTACTDALVEEGDGVI